MTATPAFLVDEVKNLELMGTLNYPGGSLTATRGVFAAMFEDTAFLSACQFEEIARRRNSYVRTEYIGADVRGVDESNWTQKKYASQAKGTAAGGEPIKLRLEGEWWSARLSGKHSALMDFLCSSSASLRDTVAWKSERGTFYGPIASIS